MSNNYWSGIAGKRMSRRRAMAISAGGATGAALLAACGNDGGDSEGGNQSSLITRAEDTSKQGRTGGVLKSWTRGDPSTLDSNVANTLAEGIRGFGVGQLTYEKPGHLKATDLEIAPDLAESWEWSPDVTQLTLKLRQGVKWHNKAPVNGRLLDANDILFSWERLARVGGSRSAWVNSVNPDAPVLSVTSPDSRTITIKLKQPLSYLLSMLAYTVGGNFQIVPKETDTTFDIRRDVIGTGPYVLADYTPSVSFTAKRNTDFYEKSPPFIDEIQMPIVTEYAAGLAQFKAGNIFTYEDLRPEDILTVKRDTPELNIYQTGFTQNNISRTDFSSLPGSPFHDERVRQAYSMSMNRDLWIDVVHNVSKFETDGLPTETRWHPCFVSPAKSWALDPRSKDFGPNTQYYQHNIAEAKKLLAAAGFPNGIDVLSTVPAGTAYGIDYLKHVEIVEGMVAEAGFRVKQEQIDYNSQFIPQFRDAKGKYDGWIHKRGAGVSWDALAVMVNDLHSKRGQNFFGFDAAGKGDQSGDPQVDSLLEKAMAEIDTEKRRSLLFEIQRYMGKKQYLVLWPGEATGFLMAWPALRNFQVNVGGTGRRNYFYWWIDDTLPPLKRA